MTLRHLLLPLLLLLSPPIAGAADRLEAGLALWRAGEPAQALEHWLPLARTGHAEAQLFVAFAYRTGRGRLADDTRAADWYRRAAEQGVPEAQLELALMYELGLGVAVDPEASAGWYAQATGGEFCPADLPAGGRLGGR